MSRVNDVKQERFNKVMDKVIAVGLVAGVCFAAPIFFKGAGVFYHQQYEKPVLESKIYEKDTYTRETMQQGTFEIVYKNKE